MSPISTGNILLVTFGDDPANDTSAYRALTDLGELNSQGQVVIEAATVISRGDDGRVAVKSQVGETPWIGTATGGLVGLLIGVLGGPVGVLIGGWSGVLIGSLLDIDDVETTESMLGEFSKKIEPGRTAVLAEAVEQSPDVVDMAMARLGGEVIRRPVVDVEAELAAAETAEQKAKFEARKELHKARVEKHREGAHAKVQELKAKLPRPKAGAAA